MSVRRWTILLIAVNFIVFALSLAQPGIADKYAMYAPAVKNGEWYRLITSCFLHAGWAHILCNMWSLWSLAMLAQNYVGGTEYILVYLGAGVCGNLMTYFVESYSGSYSMSLGASGAIFGIVGMLIALAVTGRARNLSAGRLVLGAVYMLIPGFVVSGISNTAHVGGLAGGFALTLLTSVL